MTSGIIHDAKNYSMTWIATIHDAEFIAWQKQSRLSGWWACSHHAWNTLSLPAFHRSEYLYLPFSFFFPVSCTSSPLPWHWKVCCFWFPLLDYFPFCNIIFGTDTVVNAEKRSHTLGFGQFQHFYVWRTAPWYCDFLEHDFNTSLFGEL